jgi:hypothetical protein
MVAWRGGASGRVAAGLPRPTHPTGVVMDAPSGPWADVAYAAAAVLLSLIGLYAAVSRARRSQRGIAWAARLRRWYFLVWREVILASFRRKDRK